MKAYICDQCKKQAEPDQYDLEPKGWIRLSARDENKQLHFCSATCLRMEAEARCEREFPAPAPFITGEGRTDEDAVAAASERQEL